MKTNIYIYLGGPWGGGGNNVLKNQTRYKRGFLSGAFFVREGLCPGGFLSGWFLSGGVFVLHPHFTWVKHFAK